MSDAPDDDPIELDGIIYRRADRKPFFDPPSDEEWKKIFATSSAKMKSVPKRKPKLDDVIKQAGKAGISIDSIASIEIKADGSYTIVTGKPESDSPENPWLADLRKETKK
jgi:hypothetical protein